MMLGTLGRWVLGLALLSGTLADTEIRNFRLPLDGPGSDIVPNVTIGPAQHIQLEVNQNSPEVWVGLRGPPGMWTARVSWPASNPAKFDMHLVPSTSELTLLHISSAPLTPRLKHTPLEARGLVEPSTLETWDYDTPFDVAFERLTLGAVPQATFRTLLPTIAVLVLLGAGLAKYFFNLLNFELERVEKEEQLDRVAAGLEKKVD